MIAAPNAFAGQSLDRLYDERAHHDGNASCADALPRRTDPLNMVH